MTLSPEARAEMALIARRALNAFARQESSPDWQPEHEALNATSGVFVTLRVGGVLHGCLGVSIGRNPLATEIANLTVAAATRDPRFPVMTPEEAQCADIEISVLTPAQRIASVDELEIGIHGLIITSGSCAGLLLPKVAVEQHWTREQFLDQACRKAGLPLETWKNPNTIIEIFQAEVIEDIAGATRREALK